MTETSQTDTRVKLLDAAEKLFAEGGIGATSLRAITAEAETNLASIHYHFGSKEVLIRDVFARRIEPVNQERLRLLDKAETVQTQPEVDRIVRAFVAPALNLLRHPEPGGKDFMRLMGRLYSEPGELKFQILELFQEVAERFGAALRWALPDLPPDELFWRFHFMIGSLSFTLVAGDVIEHRSDGTIDRHDVEANVDRLVLFITGGLTAPTGPHPSEKNDG